MAMPLPRVAGVDTSVTIAVDRLTLPGTQSTLTLSRARVTCHCSRHTFGHAPDDPGEHEDGEVAGEDPEQVGDGDADTGRHHQRLPPEPVAEAADDGAGEELEEGEDGAEEAAEQDGVELGGRAHAAAEPVHLDLERGEEAAAVMVAVVGDEGGEERQDQGEGCNIDPSLSKYIGSVSSLT